MREARKAYESNKALYYRPIGQQSFFHAAGRAIVRLVLGGNRSGKTVCGALEAYAHSLGFRPWLEEGHPDRIVRLSNGDPIPVPNVGRIVAENFEVNIVQTIHPKFMEWVPDGEIKHIQTNPRGVPIRYDFRNGSVIHLMSYDQDPRVFEGPSGHWAWCDEPPPRHIFNGLRRGLVDFNGHIWLTMTPLAEPWINDVIVSRANDDDGHVRLFNYSIWDNCVENGGYLSREAIEAFLSDLDDDERAARERGEFLHLAGRVFPEWKPLPPYYIPPFEGGIPPAWPRVCVIDPHPRKPIAVLWAAVSPDDQWFVYRCLFDSKLKTVREVANAIKEAEGWERFETYSWPPTDDVEWVRTDRAEPIALRIIDNSSMEPEPTSGESTFEAFAAEKIHCVLAQKRNRDAGMNAIRTSLRVMYEWGQPGLVVFNTCAPVKQNFMNYVWDRWGSSRVQGTKGEKQEPVKNNDDFIDCIRYIFQMRLNYKTLKGAAAAYSRRSAGEDEDRGMSLSGMPHAGYQRMRRPSPKSNNWRRPRG